MYVHRSELVLALALTIDHLSLLFGRRGEKSVVLSVVTTPPPLLGAKVGEKYSESWRGN